MRFPLSCRIAALALCAAIPSAWADGLETLSLNCGNGVTMDLVKIPAGHFIMGTPDPAHASGYYFYLMLMPIALIVCFALFILVRARMEKTRPQLSLLGLLLCVALSGISINCYFKERDLQKVITMQARSGKNEKPAHEVFITQPFYMGEYEVSQIQYDSLMGVTSGTPKTSRSPAIMVSWDEAVSFCQKLGEKNQQNVNLPTEAQWEFACKVAGVPAGFDPSKTAGVCNMCGGDWEWCADWYDESYYGRSVHDDPPGPLKGRSRVLRGGGITGGTSRPTDRNCMAPGIRAYNFRVVVAITPAKSGT